MTKKRILSFLLAVVLAFNCGIVMVFAETLAGPGEPAVSTGGNEPAEFSGTADPVAKVRALMDELPTGEELEGIEPAEKDGVYAQIMEAYNAYEALSEEEKEQIPEGAAFFEELLASFESGIAPLAASDTDVAYPVVGGNIYFDPTTGTITDCDETVTEVNIPSQINGVAVTSIGARAFEGCENMTTFVMSESVTSIWESAFHLCTQLSSITISKNVTYIGSNAFRKCKNLTNIIIPENVGTISQGAFAQCENLTYISIPESVNMIGMYAFNDCAKLSRVIILGDKTAIDGPIFNGCDNLKSAGPIDGDYNIQFGWKEAVPGGAFLYLDALTSVVIPEGIVTIGADAFSGCSNLTSVIIPESVTTMQEGIFDECSNLTSAGPIGGDYNIQFGWKEILPENAFCSRGYNGATSSLERVILPEGMITIEEDAFQNCNNLSSIIIPSSIISMDKDAFSTCSSLTTAGPIGGDYDIQFGWQDEIPESAFCDSALVSVTIPKGITSIGAYAFKWCRDLTYISIPEGVSIIGDNAFESCDKLISIAIPSSVTTIGRRAFYSCDNLENITISENVTAIEDETFRGCSNLTSILIPESVTEMGVDVFAECSSLISMGPIGGNYNIQVEWEKFPSFLFSKMGLADIIQSVVFPEGMTVIASQLFSGCNNLSNIIIPSSVTTVEPYAYVGCETLTTAGPIGGDYDIQFGWQNEIPKYAFRDSGLVSVTIPDGITSIKDYAFSGCESLSSLAIPDSVETIGKAAFDSCTSLSEVAIPKNVTTIGDNAFAGCENLSSVIIPIGVSNIGSVIFSGCVSLVTAGPVGGDYDIQFGWKEEIPSYAFHGSELVSIVIPDGITTIEESVFLNCNKLTNITIPASVTEISSNTFHNCDKLTDIYYAGSETDWTALGMSDNADLANTTIHYNSTGPDTGFVNDYTFVGFLSGWDPSTRKIAFNNSGIPAYDLELSVDSSVVEQLLNSFVLVTTDPDQRSTVTKLQEVETRMSEVETVVDQTITFSNGNTFTVPISLAELFPSLHEGKTAIYHTIENQIVGLSFLTEKEGVFGSWDETQYKVTISGRTYLASSLTDMSFLEDEAVVAGANVRFIESYGLIFQICPVYWEVKQFQNYDIFTNAVYFTDGTHLPIDPDLKIYADDLFEFLNQWVVYQVEKHPELGEQIIQIKELEPTLKASIKLSEDRLLYQYDKLTFTQTAGGIDYRDKDGFEIPFTVTIMTDDTSGGVVEIPAEVLESGLLDIEITNSSFTVPEGFRLEWVDGDGCRLLQTPFTLKGGETLKVGGYIRVDRSLDLPSIQNTYTLQGSVGSSAGSKSMEDAFSIQNLDLQQEQANANHEEREDSANKELADEVKDFANSWDKFVMLPSDLENLLKPAQAEKLKKLITLWITAISTEPEFEGLDEKIRDEAIDAFVEQWNQIFDYKIEGSWITSWFGVKKVKSTILVEMDTKNYGTKRFEISYNGQVYSSNEADFGDLGTLTWCMLDNEGNPSAALKGNNVGLSGGTDVKAFSDALYDIGEKAIKDFYKETIGKPVDNLVGYIFGNVTQRLLSKFGIKVSDTIFTLYTNAMKSTVVRCPVDVFVYDVDGNLCGSIVDNQVQEDDPTVSLYVDGDDKYIWYAGDDYKIRLEGTDTGTMDYEVYEYAGGELLRQVAFHDVPLTNSVVYNGEIPLELYVDAEDYSLTAEDGTRILADLDTYSPPPKIDLSNNENAPEIDSLEAEFNDDGTVSFQALTSDPDANIVSVQLTCLVGQDVLSQMMEEQDGSWLKTLSLPDGITQVQAFIMVVDADGNQVVSTPQVFSAKEGGGDDRPENPAGGEGEDIHPSIPPENDGGYVENGANSDLQNGEQNSWNRVEDQHNSDDVSNSGKENPGTGGNHGHGIVEIETNDLPERVSVYGALITVLIVMGGAGIWLWRSKEKR